VSEREYLGREPGPDREDIPDLIRKLREKRVEHRKRGRTYRIVYAAAGFTVTLIGLAMFVTPGPALVVIPIGLAMLALEFAWAERMLHKALEQADIAKQKAEEASRTQKILGGVATALAIAAFVVAAILWDIPLVPFV
jgi:uncharacterized protein (TIGR02611 family)